MLTVVRFRNAGRPLRWQSHFLKRPSALRYYTHSHSRRCPSCSAPLPTALPTCPNCSHIEALPANVSHYDLLGIPTSPNPFKVDVGDLKRRFLQAQRVCHPDAWSVKGQQALDIASAQSSRLNEAYGTLLSPVRRAQYILKEHGLETTETEKVDDPELLMEVLEAREELENAQDEAAVGEVQEKYQKPLQDALRALGDLIGEQRWEEARHAAVRLKYWQGIVDAAKDWQPKWRA